MAEPPSEVGALHPRMTWLSPPETESPVGFPGTVAGVTAGDGADGLPRPTPLMAWTVKV